MSISINWGTGVIYVPKTDMLLVQSTPIEIRELNLNNFRLTLKDLEDGEEGIPFPDTHRHNTVVEVSGIQLARVIEILEPYTVTFEDGQYAVNLVGANSNVADRVNLNQVSVRAANSAGLVQTREIEYASFNGGVTINVSHGFAGTTYPLGTTVYPVNNLNDAKFIANLRGFNTFHIKGNITINGNDNISDLIFDVARTHVYLTAGCITNNTCIKGAIVSGQQNGEMLYLDCIIGDLSDVCCRFENCGMLGPLKLLEDASITQITDFVNCRTSHDWFVLDYNHSPLNQVYSNWGGRIKIINCTDPRADIRLRLLAGTVWIDASCGGDPEGDPYISIKGIGTKINDSNIDIDVSGFVEGSRLYDLHDEAFGKWTLNPTTKTLTLYKADKITILKVFNLTETSEIVPAFIERVPT